MRIAESLDGAKDVVPAATELAAVKRGHAVANGGGL